MPAAKNRQTALDADDQFKTFTFQDETYTVRNKFKVAKFLRKLNSEPVDALEIVLTPESFEKFLELEITMEELGDFLEALSGVMAGTNAKN